MTRLPFVKLLAKSVLWSMLQLGGMQLLHAQHYSWEEFVEKLSVDAADEWDGVNPMWDDLAELHEHPFNLNTVTREELARLPFLEDHEIEEILAYVYQYGPVQSLGELMLVDELDYQTRQFLALFLYVAPPEDDKGKIRLKSMWKEGRHELITRLDVPLYERDGYKIPEDEVLLKNPNKVYLGNALYHHIRYGYRYRDRLYWGLTLEKDAGEPFGSYGNKGYDFYSFHFLLRDCGVLDALALGDFRLGFGEGLVLDTDFSFGKSTLFHMGDRPATLKKFSSTSETSFFRGVAAALRLGRFEVTAFYSYLPMDATLKNDKNISTLKTDGLHRTLLELSKKHNVTEQSVGGDVTWRARGISWGATVFYQHFSRPFERGDALYRRYYPQGKDFLNASMHYRWRHKNFLFSGETAFSDVYQGWATLNKAVYRFNSRYSVMALQRLFTYQYVGLRACSFSEGGDVRNESGWYVGAEASPLNELKLAAYVDYFRFPWPKFGIPYTSDGFEGSLQADWILRRDLNFSGRYQLKRKERYGEPFLYHKLKMQCQYFPVDRAELRLLGRYTRVRDQYGYHVRGFLLNGITKWSTPEERLRLSLSFAYFDSEDYKAPMSFYEPSVLYAFSFLTMQGRGVRMAGNVRWDCTRWLMLMLKFGSTGYFDREEIGEGLQRIGGRWKNDLSLLLRCKF